MHRTLVTLLVGTTLLLGASAAATPAEAAAAPAAARSCAVFKIGGAPYRATASRVSCAFATRWSKRMANGRQGPRAGWSCTRNITDRTGGCSRRQAKDTPPQRFSYRPLPVAARASHAAAGTARCLTFRVGRVQYGLEATNMGCNQATTFARKVIRTRTAPRDFSCEGSKRKGRCYTFGAGLNNRAFVWYPWK